MESTSMTSKYMSFSPQLVNERNVALNNCPTKSGRSEIYRTYYLKMKEAYENYEDDDEEDDEDDDEEEDEEDDEDYDEEDDEDYDEEDDEEEDEEDDKNEFGCAGCNYEWRDGYTNGWRDAMKYISRKTFKVVPPTPACSYCDIVCKTRKCGGKCGGTVRYCSIDCQKNDWVHGHKTKCGKL